MSERFARMWAGCFLIMIIFGIVFGSGWLWGALVWCGIGLVKYK